MSTSTDEYGFTVRLGDGRCVRGDVASFEEEHITIINEHGHRRVHIADVQSIINGVPAGGISQELAVHAE